MIEPVAKVEEKEEIKDFEKYEEMIKQISDDHLPINIDQKNEEDSIHPMELQIDENKIGDQSEGRLREKSAAFCGQVKKKREKLAKFKLSSLSVAGLGDDNQDIHIRSDVLYKTIIRDMRKFFSKDFNSVTKFITKKRYQDQEYLFMCLREYLTSRFEEFKDAIQYNNQTKSYRPTSTFNDLIYFLGCLLYPKEIASAMKPFENEFNQGNKQPQKVSYKIIHSYLYQFSLGKLKNLIEMKYFSYFFCFYYREGIDLGHRIEQKPKMNQHCVQYHEACNIILFECQQVLRSSFAQEGDSPEYEILNLSVGQLLAQQGKQLPMIDESDDIIQQQNELIQIQKPKRQQSQDIFELEATIRGPQALPQELIQAKR